MRARATMGAVPAGELIGRERELASLTAMLGDPEARLVTVTGPAGVGKTRLALAASEAVGPDRPDGVVRVDLAPLEDARLVAEAIAVAAGAGSSRGASALEAAMAALRERRALLVLDNFEHVEPAAARSRRPARRLPGGDGAGHEPARPRALGRAGRCRWRR